MSILSIFLVKASMHSRLSGRAVVTRLVMETTSLAPAAINIDVSDIEISLLLGAIFGVIRGHHRKHI